MASDLSNFVKELNAMIQSPSSSSASSSASSSTVTTVESPQKKVKILFATTHFNQVNGYSKVIYHMLHQLATHSWLDLVLFGTQKLQGAEMGRTLPASVKVIDGSAMDSEKKDQTGFGLAELPKTIQAEKPDVVFLYNDLSVIAAYVENIKKAIDHRSFKIWAYVDMTSPSPPQAIMDVLNREVERFFCFTKTWKDALKASGATRPVDVLTHAADPKIYRPIPKEVARQTLGLPKDMFLFVSINKNIPRKRLDLVIMSFVRLMVRFPMKPIFMLIVADKGDRGGYALFEIFSREIKLQGASVEMFGNRLLITSKDTCYRDEDINLLNNCADAGVNCAEGEGFGLCAFEQMMVGVPQVVPDINGYTEYCDKNNSLLVKPKMRGYLPQAYSAVTGEVQWVDPEDVSKAMEKYVFDEELRKRHGKAAQERTANYTWESSLATLMKRLRAVQEEDE